MLLYQLTRKRKGCPSQEHLQPEDNQLPIFKKIFFPYRVEEEIEQQGMGHPLGWGRF